MKFSLLIPICLISILTGILLPRLFEGSRLTLASVGYLLIIYLVDRIFGKSKPASGK